MVTTFRRIHNIKRTRQVITILARHGFGSILEYIELDRHLSLPRRLLKKEPAFTIPPPKHLRLALEELGPTYIKLGQILSTRPDIVPPEFIAELSKLQDEVPSAPWETVRQTIREELGKDPEQIFANINPIPIGAASLAQVHAAMLHDESKVVVKVQRPNIQDIIKADLEILNDLATLAQNTPLGKIYNPVGIVEDFAFTLGNELDYRREGRNADRFRKNFANESHLYIPQVYWEYSTKHILVLERIQGIKIDDFTALDNAGYDRKKIALYSAQIIAKEVLEDGFFHADPHPGNFVFMDNEIIGAMDFGMVGHLNDRDRINLIRLYMAGVTLNADAVVEQLIRIGAAGLDVDRAGISRDIERLLTKYYGLPLKDIRASDVMEEIMPIAYRHHLQLPSDFWLLGKTLGMMEGLGLQLDPNFDIFEVSRPIIKKLTWQLLFPQKGWLQSLVDQRVYWGDLISALPRTGSHLLDKLDRGDLFQVGIKNVDHILIRFDSMVTRLTIAILIAALIIGLAVMIPLTTPGSLLQWLIIGGFLVVAGMGIWLLVSIWRARR
ncbi:MAG: AarF/ABC1/UbiB kinase family protein [Anaerolineales bacterium]|nr:AarF/ABC1/UbiB kinase family protein [Anaerolineales bacterium]